MTPLDAFRFCQLSLLYCTSSYRMNSSEKPMMSKYPFHGM